MNHFVAVLTLALVAAASADNVVTLTEDNFKETIKANDFVLVEFYAPWCGHCKKLAPEYEKAATALKDDNIVLGAVDATVHKDLAQKYGVRGYPTLKLFKHGEATEYKGGRTEDTIVSYLRKATGPPAKVLETADDVAAFAEANKVAVVAFVSDADAIATFEKVASADEENAFAYTTSTAAAEANNIAFPGIVLFKQFDEGRNDFTGDFTKAAITDFVATNSIPLVIPFSMDVVGKIFQSSVGKVAFLLSDSPLDGYDEVAKAFKGKYVFTIADSSNGRLNSHLGYEKDQFPKFLVLETGAQMKKYPLDTEALTAAAIEGHLNAHSAGELKPHFKSEPVPESNDGPVTVVVGKNFNDVVLNPEADVLLEVYAPWCGHCKKLEPIYEELGTFFADNDKIVIAKMDGTANEVDGISIRGFPTLKFFPAGDKTAASGKDYQGGRELEDMKAYILENGKFADAKAHEEL